jgi:dolichol-phosphate mannosyltransferase
MGDLRQAPVASIILPTYNERDNIGPLLSSLIEVFDGHDFEILVVDDQSPDGTAQVVDELYGEDERVRVIVRPANPGLAYSIQEGLSSAVGDILVVMDTDFNHNPKDAVTLFKICQHVDVVVGSRFIFGGGMPNRTRYWLSFWYNMMLWALIGTRVHENLSGFFAIKKSAMDQLDGSKIFWGYGDYFFRLLLWTQRVKLKHVQVPITYGERLSGESKTQFVTIFAKYTSAALKITIMKIMKKW